MHFSARLGKGLATIVARMLTLRGRVSAGIGDLSGWMTRYSDAYERATGTALVPGSLNVILDQPWVMTDPAVRLEASEVGVGMGLMPCVVSGIACWVLRTDRNNRGEGDHDLNVLEIVSGAHLRTALGLQDGDGVTVELSA
jgi:CTP-dependent riboflavin kinase